MAQTDLEDFEDKLVLTLSHVIIPLLEFELGEGRTSEKFPVRLLRNSLKGVTEEEFKLYKKITDLAWKETLK